MKDIEDHFRFLLLDVRRQVAGALEAVKSPREADVAAVESRDDFLDNQKSVIENAVYAAIHGRKKLPEPEVRYLRAVNVAAMNLERIGDFAVNIARQTRHFADPAFMSRYDYLSHFAAVNEALDVAHPAIIERDMNAALALCQAELRLDALYKQAFDSILAAMRLGGSAGDLVTALFVFRYLERMGDALVNIGEAAIFGITGEKFKISQYNALGDALAAAGQAETLPAVEFKSIWGTRSGCRIGRVHEPGDAAGDHDVIFKDGLPEKLSAEADSIAAWEALAPGLPPRVVALRRHGKTASLLLEMLPGSTLQDILLSGEPEAMRQAFSAFGATLAGLWEKTLRPGSLPCDFMAQAIKRLPEVLSVHPGYDIPAEAVGGLATSSLRDLLASARAFEATLSAPFTVRVHGDCNSNNILYDAAVGRIHYIDLHRSKQADWCQDIAVFLVSNFRLPVAAPCVKVRITTVTRAFFDFAKHFAAAHGDTTFEARLGLGLSRALLTSTRFDLNKRFARLLFYRAVYLLRNVLAHPGPPETYRLPLEAVCY